jgi:hypothetical protein
VEDEGKGDSQANCSQNEQLDEQGQSTPSINIGQGHKDRECAKASRHYARLSTEANNLSGGRVSADFVLQLNTFILLVKGFL